MSIINHISSIISKEFLDRSLIQQRSTQNPQYFVGTSMQFEVMLDNCHQALNVAVTGLDMIIDNLKEDPSDDNYAIIEMNFNPAIHIHCHPFKGKNRKLNEKLMDALGYQESVI